jgi:hypothetical protein
MGDVLWTEPVLRAMAPYYRKIIVYTKNPILFENFPYKNVFFKPDLPFFDKVLIGLEKLFGISLITLNLDEAYENRPTHHFLHAYQQKAKLPLTNEYPKLYLSQAEKNNRLIADPYVVLHTESFSDKMFRQVYGINWEEVVAFLNAKGFKVVNAAIGPNDIKGTISVKTSVRELISMIYHAAYFIGIDSGPSHIAASLGVPSLVIFSAIDPALRHFPELFNGILLKQSCAAGCTIHDVTNVTAHHCTAQRSNGAPECCFFSTETVILQLKYLMKKNAEKVCQQG